MYIDTSNLPEWLTIASNRKDIKEKGKFSVRDASQTNTNILDEVEKWLVEIENSIFSLKPLERSDWKKGNLYRIRFYDKSTGKKIVSLIPKIRKVNVYWHFKSPQEISQNLESLLNKYGIHYSEKEHGVGNSYWFFLIGEWNCFKRIKKIYCRI